MTDRTLLNSEKIVVRWGDMDAFGHVNNTQYFRYFEQCRVNWLSRIGKQEAVTESAEGPVIISTTANYLLPLHYPATVSISMYGAEPGRSSFNSHYEIRDAKDNTKLYTTGEAKIVWVDQEKGKSKPLPSDIRELLS